MYVVSHDVEIIHRVNSVTVDLDEAAIKGIMAISWFLTYNSTEQNAFHALARELENVTGLSRAVLAQELNMSGRITTEGK